MTDVQRIIQLHSGSIAHAYRSLVSDWNVYLIRAFG
jgi:hypothetical protein